MSTVWLWFNGESKGNGWLLRNSVICESSAAAWLFDKCAARLKICSCCALWLRMNSLTPQTSSFSAVILRVLTQPILTLMSS